MSGGRAAGAAAPACLPPSAASRTPRRSSEPFRLPPLPLAQAQEAFESCEAINEQSDEMGAKAAADHAASRKALGAARQKLSRSLQQGAGAGVAAE